MVLFAATNGHPFFGVGDVRVKYTGPITVNKDMAEFEVRRHVVLDDYIPIDLLEAMDKEQRDLPRES